MTYATAQDMIDRFSNTELVQLTNRVANGTTVDSTVLGQALVDADAEIDGYLAGRYALPLVNVPRPLVAFCCDIARYRLYDDRATEQVTKRYDDAIKFLRLVADGKIGLGLSATQQPVTPAGGAQSSGPDRVFSDDLLSDYTR